MADTRCSLPKHGFAVEAVDVPQQASISPVARRPRAASD